MLRLKPTEIQLQPIEITAMRRNLDARRSTLNARARAMIRRTFYEASRDTVVLKARTGAQRSRDDSISDSVHFLHHAQTASFDQVDDADRYAADDETASLFASSLIIGSDTAFVRYRSYHDSNIMLPLIETNGAGVDDKFAAPDSGHASPITDMKIAATLVPFSLPFRIRTRQRSNSDPLSSFDGGSGGSVYQTDELAEDSGYTAPTRHPQPNSSYVLSRPTDISESHAEASDQAEESTRAPSPCAMLEAVGGLVSPLHALQSVATPESTTDTDAPVLTTDMHYLQSEVPRVSMTEPDDLQEDTGTHNGSESITADLSLVASRTRERSGSQASSSMQGLSRQNAVRLTPARRRQYARTAYTERHLQPNYAALRADRPSSEGSPAPTSARQAPWMNQENMDNGERLAQARRVWLARARTAGVLEQTPPHEGRFERYL